MGRIRTLKPEFFRSRSLARCSRDARTTFAGLWCEADDYGRGVADPRILKGAIWPLDDDLGWQDVQKHLLELEETGHLRLYEVNGEAFFEVVNWETHQAAAYRRGKPIYPTVDGTVPAEGSSEGDATPDTLRADACKEVQDATDGVLERGTGNIKRASPHAEAFGDEFESWWAGYPRRVEKQAARARFKARRREGITLGALTAARDHYAAARVGEEPRFTKHGSSFLAKDGPWSEWQNGPPDGTTRASPPASKRGPEPARTHLGTSWECPIQNPDCNKGRVLGDDGVARKCGCQA